MSKKTVLIVRSDKPNYEEGDSSTAKRLYDACIERNIKVHYIYTDNVVFNLVGGGITFSHGNEKPTKIIPSNTVAIVRGGDMDVVVGGQYVLEFLEKNNIYCINKFDAIKDVGNKKFFADILIKKNIPTPRTFFVRNEEGLELIENDLPSFPLIAKITNGTQGVGVVKVDKQSSLKSVLQIMWKYGSDVILQEMIKSDFDVRTIVIGGKIVGAMKRSRKKTGKEFRNNYSRGGDVEKYNLKEDEKKIVLSAADASGCVICGVDHIVDKDGNAYVIEVNSSPGTSGFSKFYSEIIDEIIDYSLDMVGYSDKLLIAGKKEKIEVVGIGTFEGKMDTGNYALTVLHAEEVDVDEEVKKVHFTVGGKRYTKKFIRFSRFRNGETNNNRKQRPVVLFDLKINGVVYKNIEVALGNREKYTTQVLVSAGVLEKANVLVDVRKSFVFGEGFKNREIKNIINEFFNIDNSITDDEVIVLCVLSTGEDSFIDNFKEIKINYDNIFKELVFSGLINNSGRLTPRGKSELNKVDNKKRLVNIKKGD